MTQATPVTRAVLYLRISEDTAGDELGVRRQRVDTERLAEMRGWEIVETIVENDTSAAGTVARPGFERLLRLIEDGAVDAVVAWALDRITRNRRDTVRLIEAAQKRGTVVALVRGSDLDMSSASGRMVAGILAEVSRAEIDQKSERQVRAARQRADLGKAWTSRRPFAYTPDGMELREDYIPPWLRTEADFLADAYAEFIVGKPIAEIAREWNAAGIRTSTGAEWSQPSVHQLLRNPRNAALRAYRGEVVGEGEWPAVVDEATYRAALARLTDPARRTGGGGQARYLLTGLALCGICGATVRKGQRPRDGVAFYRCGRAQHLSRTLEHVDRFVVDVVLGRLSRPDAADLLIDRQGPDTAALRTEAEEIRKRLDTLAVEFADGSLTGSQLRTATERLRARLAEAEAAMAHTRRAPVLRDLIAADDIRAAWKQTPIHRQRAVIDALAVVTLLRAARGPRFDPASVAIEWREHS